ncbi:MAG: glycosyltransferase family 1 protein [Acidobacteriota bacterium]
MTAQIAPTVSARATVLLLQDLALEGWKSMDLYAARLCQHLSLVDSRYQVTAPSDYAAISAYPIEGNRMLGLAHRLYTRYLYYPAVLRRYDADIIHILDHSYAHLLRGRNPRHTLVTVHDLFPLQVTVRPSTRIRARTALLRWVMRWCARAALLIADSDFTAREIVTLMGYPRERIRTVPLGVDERFFAPVASSCRTQLRDRLKLPDVPLLLHVGSCVERKNINAIFQVLARLQAAGIAAYLLQVGGVFTAAQRYEIERLDLTSQVKQIHYISDDELPAIYRLADLLIFPSTYEGFGLPVLEAMACGTPVVAARAASIPEVIGEAGLLAAPDDWDGLAGAAQQIIKERTLREELSERGRARATSFTWMATARKVIAVYDELRQSL